MRETEIKFPIDDLLPYKNRVIEIGARRLGKSLEENILFDDERGTLFKKLCILRLRKNDRITLTYKRPVEESTFKVMEEHEIEVSDYDETAHILSHLGYRKVFRYQKRRELFSLEDSLICLDETPIGNYIEIEAEKPSIEKTASLLHLDMNRGISKNYIELYKEYREENPDAPFDMLF